ncbi:MAG: FAD-dependent 5-carboxymethylaminomethyl-2-thiouridine(34) oxidoreductase MnmC [Cocleimonas sp.]
MSHSDNNSPWFTYPEYHWKNKHAVIIGAGIAGCQMAWHLCEEDWQVTLVERQPQIASEASGNPVGVISPKMTAKPSLGEEFYTQAFHYTLSLLETLSKKGYNLDWNPCGVQQLTHNEREINRWKALVKRNLPSDFIQLLDEKQTQKVAGIKLHSTRAYKSSFFPNAGWINPASFCKALSQHPNCTTLCETEGLELISKDNIWQLLDQNKKIITHSEVVVITSGKDINHFTQSQNLPCMPVAGQTTLAESSAVSSKLKTVIGHKGFVTPAINLENNTTQHLFGATFDRDNRRLSCSDNANNSNLQTLNKYLPDFNQSLGTIKSAHCAVRMTSPDRLPYVGALADYNIYKQNYHDLQLGKHWENYPNATYQNGLFVLAGLGSRGLTTSGLCAKSLSQLLENKLNLAQQKLLTQCHPARFIIKNLKRGIK